MEQIIVLGRRSILRVARQPGQLIFAFLLPLILFAMVGSGLGAAAKLRGFPGHSYLGFALAVPFVQGALFVTVIAGVGLARDVQTGFLSRLLVSPLRPSAVLAGELCGALAVGLAQALVYLAAGMIAGVGMKSGVLGAVALVALSTLIGVGFAGVGATFALRFGTGEAVHAFFPLLFVLVLLSSANLPRNLIGTDWFRTVATYNPVSYLIEAIRSLIVTGWDGRAIALGFGIAVMLASASIVAARAALRSRVTRS
jgi:ABC-2 type transport system permease protein